MTENEKNPKTDKEEFDAEAENELVEHINQLLSGTVEPSNNYIGLVVEELRGHLSASKLTIQRLNHARKSVIDLEEQAMKLNGKVTASREMIQKMLEIKDPSSSSSLD